MYGVSRCGAVDLRSKTVSQYNYSELVLKGLLSLRLQSGDNEVPVHRHGTNEALAKSSMADVDHIGEFSILVFCIIFSCNTSDVADLILYNLNASW